MNMLFAPLAAWPLGDLRPHFYNLIVADPPWLFENWSAKGDEKSPNAHYQCYPPEEIARMFPVGEVADIHCLLLCWGTVPLIDRQIACVKAWGFEYKTFFVWHKVFTSGKTAMGPGRRVRSMVEPVIVAVRGQPRHKAFPGLFKGVRREHSRKPEEFYEIVDRKCAGLTRRADVFVRQSRDGWDGFGNEATKFDGGGDARE
jgi:N6-adenosine-specific RNA methylase IME4